MCFILYCGGGSGPWRRVRERRTLKWNWAVPAQLYSAMGDSWSCLSCLGAEEPPVSRIRRGRRFGGLVSSLPKVWQYGLDVVIASQVCDLSWEPVVTDMTFLESLIWVHSLQILSGGSQYSYDSSPIKWSQPVPTVVKDIGTGTSWYSFQGAIICKVASTQITFIQELVLVVP